MNEKPPDPAVVRLMLTDHANCHALEVKRLSKIPLASKQEIEVLEELLRDMLSTADVLEDYLSYFRV